MSLRHPVCIEYDVKRNKKLYLCICSQSKRISGTSCIQISARVSQIPNLYLNSIMPDLYMNLDTYDWSRRSVCKIVFEFEDLRDACIQFEYEIACDLFFRVDNFVFLRGAYTSTTCAR